ncbi:MAG: uL30 family ribosomal protein [Candidatus Anstonellales archaeon]
MTQDMLAVIRVRAGSPNPKTKKTLELLKLTRVNHCVLVPSTPSLRGMIAVCKDYVAYGAPSQDIITRLHEKYGNKETLFRLHPPRGGWKSIKKPYPRGALGFHKDINKILKKML